MSPTCAAIACTDLDASLPMLKPLNGCLIILTGSSVCELGNFLIISKPSSSTGITFLGLSRSFVPPPIVVVID